MATATCEEMVQKVGHSPPVIRHWHTFHDDGGQAKLAESKPGFGLNLKRRAAKIIGTTDRPPNQV